ncbi:MAG: alcohol dehydrogenase catalytic domain-containing protein [Deltaproteobacteria bacterium]|jgi:L-iditol 2-dehydrogenase|nr:alcohol dehydrogenase catalytic domain-containing protein [Deltaproteobacteria bacterium]
MKAAVLEKPGKLAIRELPDPSCPTGGVVVKVLASNVCSTDLHMWQMGHPTLKYPRILGHEIAGVVAEVSNEEKRFKVGDKVQVYPGIGCGTCEYCRRGSENLCPSIQIMGFNLDGGFAQYLALPKSGVENGCLNIIPSSLSLSEAAMAEPLACCLNGLEKVELKKDETVLILGAGPIGCLFAMVAKHQSSGKVILFEKDSARISQARLGLEVDLLDANKVEAVMELTGGLGADVVVTCFREAALEYPLLELAAPGGRVLMFSGISQDRGVVPTDLNAVHYRELALIGAYGCTSVQCQRALDLMGEGLDVNWLISQRVNLNGLEESFSALSSKEAMKICVEP